MSKRTKQLARTYKVHKKRIKKYKNHPFIIPVVTFLVLFFVTIAAVVSFNGTTVGAGDTRVVSVFVDGQEQTLPTRAATVKDLLERLNITLSPDDVVEPALDTQILEDDFMVNVYRARPVTIIEGTKKVTVNTTQTDLKKVAEQAGFALHPEDELAPALPSDNIASVADGAQFLVDRAPVIPVNLYGITIQLRTRAETVGEALNEKDITLQTGDVVTPSTDTKITPTTQISVTNPNKQFITVEENTPMPVESVDDPSLPLGAKVVKQVGSPGKKVVTYELKLENGREVGRTAVQIITVSEPVKQIEARGTKVVTVTGSKADWMAAAGISPSDYVYVDYIIGRESGWRPGAVSANRCIGLGQKCNAQSLINACPNWQSDPVCQLQHFSGYSSRYGGWAGAYNFWQANHWW